MKNSLFLISLSSYPFPLSSFYNFVTTSTLPHLIISNFGMGCVSSHDVVEINHPHVNRVQCS